MKDSGQNSKRLEDYLLSPKEQLNFEIKEWINISDDGTEESKKARAKFAKEILALANHGGGKILIGYHENGEDWSPELEDIRPLEDYEQDNIQDIVDRYADPTFQCQVNFVAHPQKDQKFPIIEVPGGHKVPVRAKRDGSYGVGVKQNNYYIRRPGPKSEKPQESREWDKLIRRCVTSSKEELLDNIRNMMSGYEASEQVDEEEQEELEEWKSECISKWKEKVNNHYGDVDSSPYQHGYWTCAYQIEEEFEEESLSELREVLREVKGTESGWPPWNEVTHGDAYVEDGCIECWIVGHSMEGPAHTDFWRVSKDGRLFLLRGYESDDENKNNYQPGKFLDFFLPIWRSTECLLHSKRLSEALSVPNSPVKVTFEWTGLKGRELKSDRGVMLPNRISQQSNVELSKRVIASEVRSNLPEIVQELNRPLYESFNFFDPEKKVFNEQIDRILGRQN